MLYLPFNEIKTRCPIYLAGFSALLVAIQLITFTNYVVIFLEKDLITSILIITIIVSLRNFLQIFFRIPLGELSQNIGRKPLIIFGYICMTSALLLLGLSQNWLFVLVATIIIALGMSAFWPALFSFISDFTPDEFGNSNGKIFSLFDVGLLISTLVSKLLLDVFYLNLNELFLIISSFGVISFFVILIILPESLPDEKRIKNISIFSLLVGSITKMFDSLIKISKEKGMLEVFLFQFVLAFLSFVMQAFFPVLVVDRGFSKGTVAEIFFWSTLILIWFKPRLGRTTDNLPFLPTMMSLIFIACAAMYLVINVLDLWLIIVLYVIYFAAVITGYAFTNGETARRSPQGAVGTSLGVVGVYVSLGRTTSTLSLGLIWEFIGLETVFYVTILLVIVASIVLWFIYNDKSVVDPEKVNMSSSE